MSTPTTRRSMAEMHRALRRDIRECVAALEANGYTTYVIRPPEKSHNTLGVPQIYTVHPDRGPLWVLVKAERGKVSRRERDFMDVNGWASVPVVAGRPSELAEWLETAAAEWQDVARLTTPMPPWYYAEAEASAELADAIVTQAQHAPFDPAFLANAERVLQEDAEARATMLDLTTPNPFED